MFEILFCFQILSAYLPQGNRQLCPHLALIVLDVIYRYWLQVPPSNLGYQSCLSSVKIAGLCDVNDRLCCPLVNVFLLLFLLPSLSKLVVIWLCRGGRGFPITFQVLLAGLMHVYTSEMLQLQFQTTEIKQISESHKNVWFPSAYKSYVVHHTVVFQVGDNIVS